MKQIDRLVADHIRADVTVLVSSDEIVRTRWGNEPEWIAQSLHSKAKVLSAPFLDYEAAARAAGWQLERTEWDNPYEPHITTKVLWAKVEDEISRSYSDDRLELLCQREGLNPHEIPIIGHYIVTAELADKLEARGERVERDFGGVIVWARKKSSDEHAEQMDAKGVSVEFLDRDPVLLAVASEIYP